MTKISEWMDEHGLKSEKAYNRAAIDVFHKDNDKLAFSLSGSELAYRLTTEATISLLESKWETLQKNNSQP